LADPARNISAFHDVQFFKDFPYALPAVVSGAFCMTTVLVCIFALKEVREVAYSPVHFATSESAGARN
jgi:hypothetical protein